MKPHVCVDARLINAAGIGTLLQSSLKALSKIGTICLTLLGHRVDQRLLSSYLSEIIWIKSGIYTLKEQFELPKKIPKCDLFWAPHFNIPLLPIRAKKRLTTICDVYHLANSSCLTLFQKMYAQILYNAVFLLSDQVLTISEFSQNEILKFAFFKPKNLIVVPPALDFQPEPSSSIFQEKDFLLSVGNLKPHKNLLRLVQAYAKLQPKNPLVIVGKKEGLKTTDEALFNEVERDPFLKKNVHFTGQISDQKLKKLYVQALLFIFPSTYEGFGYPPLEAMASLCPVLASKAGSIPEVCGDAVEYINPYSVDSIAEGIHHLLNNPERREELIRRGWELVEKKRKENNRIVDVIDACCNCT